MRAFPCAVLAFILFAARLPAAETNFVATDDGQPNKSNNCCPHCGSENVIGSEVVAACTDCGQATILGLSLPFATLIGGVLVIFGVVAVGLAVRRLRGRKLTDVLGYYPFAARTSLCALLALVVFAGSLLAGEATIISYDKDTMKLVVKQGDKERTIELKRGTHVHDANGKEVKLKDRGDKLLKGTKIDIEEKQGSVTEINIKK